MFVILSSNLIMAQYGKVNKILFVKVMELMNFLELFTGTNTLRGTIIMNHVINQQLKLKPAQNAADAWNMLALTSYHSC
jgi:hypothetical protein